VGQSFSTATPVFDSYARNLAKLAFNAWAGKQKLMGNLGSLFSIILTALVVPWVVHRLPYFSRPDILARRAVRAKLPAWASLTEMVFLVASVLALTVLFFKMELYVHQFFHPELEFLRSPRATFSLDSLFMAIETLAPLMAALPLGMILANLVSWSISPIRNVENKIMAEGVAGYTWKDLNMGLVRGAAVMVPVSIVTAFISLRRF
jgi:hypothetical protein